MVVLLKAAFGPEVYTNGSFRTRTIKTDTISKITAQFSSYTEGIHDGLWLYYSVWILGWVGELGSAGGMGRGGEISFHFLDPKPTLASILESTLFCPCVAWTHTLGKFS